jgi:hypothetical protein
VVDGLFPAGDVAPILALLVELLDVEVGFSLLSDDEDVDATFELVVVVDEVVFDPEALGFLLSLAVAVVFSSLVTFAVDGLDLELLDVAFVELVALDVLFERPGVIELVLLLVDITVLVVFLFSVSFLAFSLEISFICF